MAQEIVEAPIPGKIVKVNVKVGDTVSESDTLCEIESMKMENPIIAPVSGKITEVGINTGDVVKTGDKLAVIEY